jgi:hypothetical protein
MTTDIGSALNALPTNVAGFWRGDLSTLFSNLATAFLVVAVVTSTFLLLWGAIRLSMSGHDKEGLASAQKRITAALVGLAIAFSIWAIMSLVKHFFGIGQTGGGPLGTGAPAGAPAAPPETEKGWVDCCEHPEVYGKNGYTVSVADCKAARADPDRQECVADGQIDRWYQYEVVHCDQFFINKGCWESH